jgi:hypothetical protein
VEIIARVLLQRRASSHATGDRSNAPAAAEAAVGPSRHERTYRGVTSDTVRAYARIVRAFFITRSSLADTVRRARDLCTLRAIRSNA